MARASSIVCFVSLALLTGAEPAAAAFPGINGEIAFESLGLGQRGNMVGVPGETQATFLGDGGRPSYSADGSRIVFQNGDQIPGCNRPEPGEPDPECAGEHELFAMDADGGHRTRLTNSANRWESDASWHPDGDHVVYTDNVVNDIQSLELSSGEVQNLTPGDRFGHDAVYSPDGTQVAYQSSENNDADFDVFIMDADGSDPRNLTNHGGANGALAFDGHPAWSPDGSEIAFRTGRAAFGDQRIATIPVSSPDGSGVTLLTGGPNASQPDWSPDGDQIAYGTTPDGYSENTRSDIYTVPAAGGTSTLFSFVNTAEFYDESFPAWRPIPGVSEEADAGDTVSTGTESTEAEPVQTDVTTPNAGTVTIRESAATGSPGTGFAFLGRQLDIEAPDASVADPLVLSFLIDASLIPPGGDEDSFDLYRDGVAIPECTGAPSAIPDPCISQRAPLAGGDVRITARSSHASVWQLAAPDSLAPDTTITARPPKRTRKRAVSFSFEGSEANVSFACKLDGAALKPCTSPGRYKRLKPRRHRFTVVATDAAGNSDPEPATATFKVTD